MSAFLQIPALRRLPAAWRSCGLALATAMGLLPLAGAEEANLSLLPLLKSPAAASHPLVLLGEVHDNALQHRLRLQAFEALLAAGDRPALLMEQFDRERQSDIDQVLAQARREGTRADADALIHAASDPGHRWEWDFYRPFIRLALEQGLPIVAANVSRADARLVTAQGLTARGFEGTVPPEISATQAGLIVRSHCGTLDEAQGRRMARAQIARDQYMASLIERHRARGVVLLAGNGHVRRDIGVARWLSEATRAKTWSVGLLEEGDDSPASAFDHTLTTPRQPREDPCAHLTMPPAKGASHGESGPTADR